MTLTMKQLDARLRRAEEQLEALTELLIVDDEPEPDQEGLSLEAQHDAFAARLKEKRR